MRLLWLIFRRDVLLAWRRGGSAWNTPLFFALCMVFFAFGLGAEALRIYATHAACVSVFLSVLLTAPNLFEGDVEDGTIEQYLLFPVAFELVVLVKLLANWISQLLPVVLLAPWVVNLISSGTAQETAFIGALLPATASLLAIAGFSAALTLGSRKATIVQALIALPFYVPVLIFASAGVVGEGGSTAMLMLLGMLMLFMPMSCVASAALLRMAQE